MKLEYVMLESLPPLAWYADVKDGICRVTHGKWVDTAENWFVEGAWNGEFSEGGFCEADWFCGTGGRAEDGKLVFSAATDMMTPLFIRRHEDGSTAISNSMCMLMAIEELETDPLYIYYETDSATANLGFNKYKKQLHLLDKNGLDAGVEVYYFRTVEISDGGNIHEIVKPTQKAFNSFEEYRDLLRGGMQKLCGNARAAERRHVFGITTTISSGYDAACCAAIAKCAGCDTAVTFAAKGKYKEDNGSRVAEKLGYKNIVEKDADAYMKRDDFIETEYICSTELGDYIAFSAFDEEFAGNIVVMGDRGGYVWDKNADTVNGELTFYWVTNALGNLERRIQLGYIYVPMPFFHATAWPSLHAISNSPEMDKWSLHNDYDRPIPRRILEESGVPREFFGMVKHGAGFRYKYDWMSRIKKKMSPASAEDFDKYVKQHRDRNVLRNASNLCRYMFKMKNIYLGRLGFKVKPVPEAVQGETANPMAPRYLVPWAAEHMTEKYKNQLHGVQPADAQ